MKFVLEMVYFMLGNDIMSLNSYMKLR